MKRLAILAVFASAGGLAFGTGSAQAQTVCCVDPGMRGYFPAPPPPGAGSGLRGYVGVEYSKARLTPGTPSPRIETWTGEGAIAMPLGGFGLQADVKAARYSGPFGDDWVTSPTLHLYRRNPYGALGGFIGVSNSGGATLYGGGIEGQANMSGATLYGTLGFGRINDTVDSDIFAARVEGRYFLTENLRVDSSLGYIRQSANNVRSEGTVAAVGAEYQFGAFPASVHVGYQRASARDSNAASDTLRVGVRWAFNGETLAQRDRYGPSFGNVTDIFMGN